MTMVNYVDSLLSEYVLFDEHFFCFFMAETCVVFSWRKHVQCFHGGNMCSVFMAETCVFFTYNESVVITTRTTR